MSDTQYYLLDKKVVFISKDKDQLNYFNKSFLCAGAQVYTYTSESEGLDAIDKQKPDLAVFETSDTIGSPEELISKIRSNEKTKELPVIIILDENTDESMVNNKTKFVLKKDLKKIDIFKVVEELLVGNKETKMKTSGIFDLTEDIELPMVKRSNKDIRVLILEDDPFLRDLLSTKLENNKISYELCHSGLTALSFMKTYEPNVIILDISLPDKNGLEVLADIRATEQFKETPVIIFSNNDNPEERGRAHALKVESFLVKAMTDLNDLMSMILRVAKK